MRRINAGLLLLQRRLYVTAVLDGVPVNFNIAASPIILGSGLTCDFSDCHAHATAATRSVSVCAAGELPSAPCSTTFRAPVFAASANTS